MELEGDAKQIIDALKDVSRELSNWVRLMEDTRKLLLSMLAWKVSHVKREGKQVAHYLANEALSLSIDTILIDEVLEFIWPLVDVNCNFGLLMKISIYKKCIYLIIILLLRFNCC